MSNDHACRGTLALFDSVKRPCTLVLTLKTEQDIYRGAALYSGAQRTGDWELTYVADDVMEIIRAHVGMRR